MTTDRKGLVRFCAQVTGILPLIFACFFLPAINSYAENLRTRPLIARGEDNYPPYEFLDEQGKPAGFNVDVVKAVAAVMGFDLDIQLRSWSQVRQEIESGQIDISIAMFYTPKRDRLVDFSTPYNIVSYSIFVRKGTSIQSLDELKDMEILVQEGDFGHDYMVSEGLSDNLILVENMENALRKLASGMYDCAIISKLHGLYLVNKYDLRNIVDAGLPLESPENCMAVSEGNEVLLGQLNEGLSIIKATGRYEELYREWFSVYEEGLFTRVNLKYVLYFVSPLALLLVGIACWTWSLKRQVFLKTKELRDELSERMRTEIELKKSHELLRELTMHLHLAREEERGQVARDVHDELGQIFTVLQLDLYYLKQKFPQKKGKLIDKINDMLELIDTSCDMIQEITTRLRPRLLDHLGLVAAMEWQLEDFERRTNIKCSFEKNFEKLDLDKNLAISIFRIFQETLTNVARHAEAKKISIVFKKDGRKLMLKMKDDGKGITEEEITNPKSFGLIGMHERISPWSGKIEISGAPNQGTTIILNLTLNPGSKVKENVSS